MRPPSFEGSSATTRATPPSTGCSGLAHQRAGRHAASHMALAEFHVRNGDLESAIRQLDIALGDPAIDDYRQARAEARRQQLIDQRPRRR